MKSVSLHHDSRSTIPVHKKSDLPLTKNNTYSTINDGSTSFNDSPEDDDNPLIIINKSSEKFAEFSSESENRELRYNIDGSITPLTAENRNLLKPVPFHEKESQPKINTKNHSTQDTKKTDRPPGNTDIVSASEAIHESDDSEEVDDEETELDKSMPLKEIDEGKKVLSEVLNKFDSINNDHQDLKKIKDLLKESCKVLEKISHEKKPEKNPLLPINDVANKLEKTLRTLVEIKKLSAGGAHNPTNTRHYAPGFDNSEASVPSILVSRADSSSTVVSRADSSSISASRADASSLVEQSTELSDSSESDSDVSSTRVSDSEASKAKTSTNSPAHPSGTRTNSSNPQNDINFFSRFIETINKNQNAFEKFILPKSSTIQELDILVQSTDKALEDLKNLNSASINKHKTTMQSELEFQKILLLQKRQELINYVSPDSHVRRMEERQLFVDAAIRAFDQMGKNYPDKKKNNDSDRFKKFQNDVAELQKALGDRRQMIQKAVRTKTISLDEPLKGQVITQKGTIAEKLIEKYADAFNKLPVDTALDEKTWLTALINDFLKAYPEADDRKGSTLLKNAKGWVLNHQQDWQVIECDVMVPVTISKPDSSGSNGAAATGASGKISAVSLAKIQTKTTPLGHIFNLNTVSVDSDNAAITKNQLAEYQWKDANDSKKIITAGRNSHATIEHAHGVNVARTEATSGDVTLFSGTRHATLSAYDIYPDKLRKADPETLKKMANDLLASKTDPVQINVTGKKATAQRAAPKPSARAPNRPAAAPNRPAAAPSRSAAAPNRSAAAQRPIPTGRASLSAELQEFEARWAAATNNLTADSFVEKLISDSDFCALVRRKVALNRAREAFLSEALGNPAMLERIQQGEAVYFNSISLITPDPLRHLLAKLKPVTFRKNDELGMRKEELQGWRDLQAELNLGRLEIDGQTVQGTVNTFCIGVNSMALSDGNPLARALTSGWNQVSQDNRDALVALIGEPDQAERNVFGGQVGDALNQYRTELKAAKNQKNNELVRKCNDKINKLETIANQLAAMWNTGEYRRAGDQPYKFAARLAVLSSELNAGTAFNCKSGKDRTGQLDIEAKLLAIQTQTRLLGAVDPVAPDDDATPSVIAVPYRDRKDFERRQLQHLIFGDKSRTAMQRYNTGVEGSKLEWQALFKTIAATGDDPEELGKEIVGRSFATAT